MGPSWEGSGVQVPSVSTCCCSLPPSSLHQSFALILPLLRLVPASILHLDIFDINVVRHDASLSRSSLFFFRFPLIALAGPGEHLHGTTEHKYRWNVLLRRPPGISQWLMYAGGSTQNDNQEFLLFKVPPRQGIEGLGQDPWVTGIIVNLESEEIVGKIQESRRTGQPVPFGSSTNPASLLIAHRQREAGVFQGKYHDYSTTVHAIPFAPARGSSSQGVEYWCGPRVLQSNSMEAA